MYWTSPDGLDLPFEIMDKALGETCTDSSICQPGGLGGLEFIDPDCSQPVFVGGRGLVGRTSTLWISNEIYMATLGAELLPAPTLQCPSNRMVPPGGHFYSVDRLARSSDPGVVVNLATAYVPLIGLDEAWVVQGDDCSDAFVNIVRDEGGTFLFPLPTSTGELRWLPPRFYLTQNTCLGGGTAPTSTLFTAYDSAGLAVGVYHVVVGGACTTVGPFAEPGSWYDRGTEVPLTDFQLASWKDFGGTRLVRTAPSYADQPVLFPFTLFAPAAVHDKELGIDCRPDVASDGETRCLPRELQLPPMIDSSNQMLAPGFVVFADAACTKRIVAFPASAAVPRFAREPSDTWDSCSATMYKVGTAVSRPATIYAHPNLCGHCEPITLDAGFAFRAVTEAPAAMFSPIQREVR